jgi:hypothetical protein
MDGFQLAEACCHEQRQLGEGVMERLRCPGEHVVEQLGAAHEDGEVNAVALPVRR